MYQRSRVTYLVTRQGLLRFEIRTDNFIKHNRRHARLFTSELEEEEESDEGQQ